MAASTTTPGSEGRTLRSAFLAAAAAHADAPALRVGEATLTYAQLEHRARVIAAAIAATLDRPARRVGVLAARSEVAYTGVLAALVCGAAFVPLGRSFPVERLRRMIARAELDALIVDEAAHPLLERLVGHDRFPRCVIAPARVEIDLDDDATGLVDASALDRTAPLSDLPAIDLDDVAYLLFTSGSTGEPKGVPVTHRNVLHFLDVVRARYEITASDRLSQTFDQTFDLSVFDQFAAWTSGASVCVPQPIELLAPDRFVRRHELTIWFSVPSVPALMRRKNLLKPASMPSLRWSLFCGEPLPVHTAEAWQAAAPGSVVENLYGPTELTIACLVHRWDPDRSPARSVHGIVPIGRPFPGLHSMIVDETLGPAPPHEDGELCVAGPQTVPGYWRDPEQTDARFVALEGQDAGMRFYRTGDRVRLLDDGEYVFLGRTDHQVKVRGHRVELAEIEAVLRDASGATDAVAIAWPVVDGSAEGIVGFLCDPRIESDAVIERVRAVLPAYEVPSRVVAVDSMPLNANGKIDRNALAARLHGDG